MNDTITIIDLSVKPEQIENLNALPEAARKVFDKATSMSVRGFQEVNGYIGRHCVWSCAGYWTAEAPDGKFHITSMGDGTQLFVE